MGLRLHSGLSDPYGAANQQRGFGLARDAPADRPRSLYANAANYVNMQPSYAPFGRPPAPLPAEASPSASAGAPLSPAPNWQPPSWSSDASPPDDEETHYASQLRSSMAALLHGGHIRQSSSASNASSTFSSYSDEFRSPTAELGLPPAAPFPDYPGYQSVQAASPPPPPPPVRDASSLKYVKYGPGHEKYPSWPVPHQPSNQLQPAGGSQRSKSWTEHTDYPKEPPAAYARPSARPAGYSQQLKTVMENCERILPDVYHAGGPAGELGPASYGLPPFDCDGRNVDDKDYNIPSPPERDLPRLAYSNGSPTEGADYAKYEDIQQYSHSEGYSSYVPSESSYASVSGTPLLDQLRRDGESAPADGAAGVRDSISTVVTHSSSNSSNETLRWHGSYSDISVTSSAGRHAGHPAESAAHVVHSAKVQAPQRHNSESVLYYEHQQQPQPQQQHSTGNYKTINRMGGWNQRVIERKNQWNAQSSKQPALAEEPVETPAPLSVAERIHQLEWQSKSVPNLAQRPAAKSQQSPASPASPASPTPREPERYTFLDPDKRMKVADPTLKAIQKQALMSYYERHRAANGSAGSPPKSSPPPPALPRTSSQSLPKVLGPVLFAANRRESARLIECGAVK